MPRATRVDQRKLLEDSHLILGVGVGVILLALIALRAVCRAAKALGGEAHAVDVLARLLALVLVLFFFTT
jgi:cytochrome b561